MSESKMTPRDTFRSRIREIGIVNTEILNDEDNKLYVFPSERGYGFTADCYEGLEVRLIESIGMDSLFESHRLHREYSHHVLIFTIEADD